jgi:hypothetical protein
MAHIGGGSRAPESITLRHLLERVLVASFCFFIVLMKSCRNTASWEFLHFSPFNRSASASASVDPACP